MDTKIDEHVLEMAAEILKENPKLRMELWYNPVRIPGTSQIIGWQCTFRGEDLTYSNGSETATLAISKAIKEADGVH